MVRTPATEIAVASPEKAVALCVATPRLPGHILPLVLLHHTAAGTGDRPLVRHARPAQGVSDLHQIRDREFPNGGQELSVAADYSAMRPERLVVVATDASGKIGFVFLRTAEKEPGSPTEPAAVWRTRTGTWTKLVERCKLGTQPIGPVDLDGKCRQFLLPL